MSASNNCRNFCTSPANQTFEANGASVINNPQNFLLNWPSLNSKIHPSATDIVRNATLLQNQFHLTRPHPGTITVEKSLSTLASNPSQKQQQRRPYHAQKDCTYDVAKGAKRKTKPRTARKIAVQFPVKLMKVLSSKQYEHIIAWTNNGSCFEIKSPSLLVKKVLPLYFKEVKYASFTRKLHRWGFVRTDLKDSSKAQTTYFNKYFQRGDPDLCKKMYCSKRGGPCRYLSAMGTGSKVAESGRRSDFNPTGRSEPTPSSAAGTFEAPIINNFSPQKTLFGSSIQDEQIENQQVQALEIHPGLNYTQYSNMLSTSAHEMLHSQKVTDSSFQRMKRQEQNHRCRRLGETNMENLTRQGQHPDSEQVSFANDLSSDGLIILRAAYEFKESLSAMRRQGRISTDAAINQFTSQVEQQRQQTKIRPRKAFRSSTMTAPSA